MTLYFDYSGPVRWDGPATGIPRTEICILAELRKSVTDLQCIVTNDVMDGFHHLGDASEPQPIDSPAGVYGAPVAFQPGDVLLTTGPVWAIGSYFEKVDALKALGVQFYQVFYDLIPAKFPYLYEPGLDFGDYYGDMIQRGAALCDGGFAISECSKRDLVTWCGGDDALAERIHVIRLGEDFTPPSNPDAPPLRFAALNDFLLCVGTLELRKNQVLLLNAYRLLAEAGARPLPKLVLCGRDGYANSNLRDQVANDRSLKDLVVIIEDASDAEVEDLFRRCRFSLFPAFYEGWGLPVAESLRLGRPCICSNTSSMLEIAPDLTIFASPHNALEWSERIGELLSDDAALEQLAKRVAQGYTPTNWSSTACAILKTIEQRSNIK